MKREFKINLDKKNNCKIDERTGFLTVRARFTRTGVFDYGNHKELRTPEEVFNPDSISSLELVPVTFLHPEELVNVDNNSKYDVGTVGEKIEVAENKYLEGNIQIRDKSVIEYVQEKMDSGKSVELSCGYFVELEEKSGEYEGQKYDAVQKNITYNHLAIVPQGRAGKNVKLMLDARDDNNNKGVNEMKIKKTLNAIKTAKINFDAVKIEYSEDSEQAVSIIEDRLDAALEKIKEIEKELASKKDAADYEKLQGKFDQLAKDHEDVKKNLDALNDPNSEEFQKRLDSFNQIKELCDVLKVDWKEKSLKEIKVACIQAKSKDFNPENISDERIDGRFEMLIENIAEIKTDENNKTILAVKAGTMKQKENKDKKEETPREKMERERRERFEKVRNRK